MAEVYLIRDLFGVPTDGEDWPGKLGEDEKAALVGHVREVLLECVPLTTQELYERVMRRAERDPRCPVFGRAVLLDWTRAVVARAARKAGAEQRWHLPSGARGA